MNLEQFKARCVMTVIAIEGVQRTGVDDQRDYPTSPARISSIRSEMSDRPLAPPRHQNRRPNGTAHGVEQSALREIKHWRRRSAPALTETSNGHWDDNTGKTFRP